MIDKDLLKNLTVEQKQVLLDQLMNSLSETKQKEEAVSSKPQSTVTEDFRVTSSKTELERGRVPVKARKNQWVDDGQFQLEGEDEWSNNRKRTSRSRSKTTKVEVECSVCGKTFMENPSLMYGEYHRCNRCGRR
jgi:DNA-directed RNA polymerase subunit RPC12/RpoP